MSKYAAQRLPVFFDPRMVADSGVFSPSAGKPAKVVRAWAGSRGVPHDRHAVQPVTEAELCRSHDAGYVRGVLSGHRRNGFGNCRSDVALSLPWTSGALLTAARYALANPAAPAPCAPVSGFHHAGWYGGGGFCTFNGLTVAALALLASGEVGRVGILDADMHYGNGTDDVLDRLRGRAVPWFNDPSFSSFAERVSHVTFGATHGRPDQADGFLAEALPAVVYAMGRNCDVVLYQAGADPHVSDPLGGWLTTDQLAERDRIVFEGFRTAGVPVAWDFAGGYQKEEDGSIPKVIEIHTNTARAALRAAGGK